MAKQKPSIVSGRIANIIFYEFRGKQCSRSMPRRVPATVASKASAKKFGMASRLGSQVRSGLHHILPDPKDKKLMYRLNTVVAQWLRTEPAKDELLTDVPFIDQFQFNEKSELNARLKRKLTVDWSQPGKVVLNIPDLKPQKEIAAPVRTQLIKWKIAAIRCTVEEFSHLEEFTEAEFEMPYNGEEQAARQVELAIAPMAGEITIVAVSLRYSRNSDGKEIVEDKRWLPGGIVGTCYGNPV